jgi:hypothetical protein
MLYQEKSGNHAPVESEREEKNVIGFSLSGWKRMPCN